MPEAVGIDLGKDLDAKQLTAHLAWFAAFTRSTTSDQSLLSTSVCL